MNEERERGRWVQSDPALTDDDGSNGRLVKDPTGGDVGDADPAVAIANRSQEGEEFLKEGPIAPRFQYHIKVLNSFEKIEERNGVEAVVAGSIGSKKIGWGGAS